MLLRLAMWPIGLLFYDYLKDTRFQTCTWVWVLIIKSFKYLFFCMSNVFVVLKNKKLVAVLVFSYVFFSFLCFFCLFFFFTYLKIIYLDKTKCNSKYRNCSMNLNPWYNCKNPQRLKHSVFTHVTMEGNRITVSKLVIWNAVSKSVFI